MFSHWKILVFKYMSPSLGMTTIFQLSFFLAVFLACQIDVSIWWWIVSLILSFFVYSMIGNNIALHRYFSHGHFIVSKPVEYILLWLGSSIGMGSPISYAITHHIHHDHRYTDTELDPHGPVRGWKSLLLWYQKPVDSKITPSINRRIAQLIKKYSWLHKFYVPLFLLNGLLFLILDYQIFLFGWWIPASLSCWAIAFAVIRQHYGLHPRNSKLARIDVTFEGLHYNHHLFPRAPNTALHKDEIDWTFQLSKLIAVKYDWRGQPPVME